MDELGAIGRRLASRRKAAGLTQEEVATRTGLSWSYLSRLETGRRGALKLADLLALARVLGVSVAELLGEQDRLHAAAARSLVREPRLLSAFARLQSGLETHDAPTRARVLGILESLAELFGAPLSDQAGAEVERLTRR